MSEGNISIGFFTICKIRRKKTDEKYTKKATKGLLAVEVRFFWVMGTRKAITRNVKMWWRGKNINRMIPFGVEFMNP